MKYHLDEKFTPRDLTSEEKVFLNALVSYTMPLDKSLFFQIADLQRHTKLEFSMNGGRFKHSEYIEREVLEKELKELAIMLDGFREKLWFEKLPDENWDLYEIWEEEWIRLNDKLKELIDNPGKRVDSMPLGLYQNKGDKSKVVLFVDSIEERAKNDPYDTMLLMGAVLLHEYFHSFHFHAGTGAGDPPRCIEEPMADYGSLVMLDRVASSGLPIAKDAKNALEIALDFVKSKRQRTMDTAGYGFGACLYENHKEEASNLIALYANVSCLMDDKTLEIDQDMSDSMENKEAYEANVASELARMHDIIVGNIPWNQAGSRKGVIVTDDGIHLGSNFAKEHLKYEVLKQYGKVNEITIDSSWPLNNEPDGEESALWKRLKTEAGKVKHGLLVINVCDINLFKHCWELRQLAKQGKLDFRGYVLLELKEMDWEKDVKKFVEKLDDINRVLLKLMMAEFYQLI